MQRREAKNRPERPQGSPETKEWNDTGENPHRNGLSGVGAGICGFVGLDGGDHLDQTGCSPRRDRTSLRNSSQERNFLLQRPGGEMGSFASIAGAETALAKEFSRHVFEIAALLRVSRRLYNYRVWVVETIWTKLAAPHAVIETSLRNSSQERNFLLQRPGGETGSFGSIAGAETCLLYTSDAADE